MEGAAASPAISVVVPTRDRAGLLGATLDALAGQTLAPERIEVVVVDDGSGDDTGAVLAAEARRQRFGRFRALRRDAAGGPAVARNAGWEAATAPLVAFTDDDCRPAPEWLERLLAAAAERPGAAVQGRTAPDPEGPPQTPFTRTLAVSALGPFYPTCNIAYPRELLARLGGFDESYPQPGGEDTDLALRALDAGAEIAFAPDALVHHAVVDYGPLGKLRWALHWSDAMQVIARHPRLRGELRWGIFWKESHALLLLALAGLALGRRSRPALLLALPYLRQLRLRAADGSAGPLTAPYLALYDAVETYATVRGALRHRSVII